MVKQRLLTKLSPGNYHYYSLSIMAKQVFELKDSTLSEIIKPEILNLGRTSPLETADRIYGGGKSL